jgi:hypothetical protein
MKARAITERKMAQTVIGPKRLVSVVGILQEVQYIRRPSTKNGAECLMRRGS